MFVHTRRLYRSILFAASTVLAIGVLSALLVFVTRPGYAAGTAVPQNTFMVTTNADTNDGSCDAHCSLREAIVAANTLPGPDVILFSLLPASQTITLTAELPSIEDDLTIEGGTNISLTISGNNLYRPLLVSQNISATLAHLSIVNGYSNQNGGGIYNDYGNLTLENVLMKDNVAENWGGGVINYYGVLHVHHSAFINNSAQDGGAILNWGGVLEVENSSLVANLANDLGGGIVSVAVPANASVSISRTSFISNVAIYGGGLFASDSLTITNSQFTQNRAAIYGGGLLNDAKAVIRTSTFFSNTAGHSGGAIHNDYALILNNSDFHNNMAEQYGGAIVNYGTEFYSATVTTTQSLFQGNTAGYGGGIANWSGTEIVVRNSTFSANRAITAGGGISNSQSLHLNNVTMSDNEATTGGGIVSSGTMTMSNSIIANSVGGDCANSGLFGMNVNNLIEDGSCNPLLSGDPLLAPLADNGGETWTFALLWGSPAIDAGDDNTCEMIDQRGVLRPLDGDGDGTAVCDIGALEQEPPPEIMYTSFLPILLKP